MKKRSTRWRVGHPGFGFLAPSIMRRLRSINPSRTAVDCACDGLDSPESSVAQSEDEVPGVFSKVGNEGVQSERVGW